MMQQTAATTEAPESIHQQQPAAGKTAVVVPISRWPLNVRHILAQITEIRKDDLYTIYASADFSTIRIDSFTKHAADHFLCLRTVGANADVHVHSHSLPDLFGAEPTAATAAVAKEAQQAAIVASSNSIFGPCGTIATYVNAFQLYLEQLDQFYDYMNTIDAMCFVVEPTVITTKSTSRIFKIENNVFVRITVDPLALSSIVCTIIGPSYATGRYRDLYDRHIANWDTDLDIYQNMLRIFAVTAFPVRPTATTATATDSNCGICLEYRHCDQHIPLVACDNERCTVVYHTACLRQWFAAQPESRTFLDVTFGKCPYCKDKLSASFVSLFADAPA